VSAIASERERRNVLGKDFNLPPALNNMASLDQSVEDRELSGTVQTVSRKWAVGYFQYVIVTREDNTTVEGVATPRDSDKDSEDGIFSWEQAAHIAYQCWI
jgi:hypothetical protein